MSVKKGKHFTGLEKKYFLDILKRFAHVVECRKSNSASLLQKKEAWQSVCEEYNNSAVVTEKRSVCQLKKLCTNLKQGQRDALTKEKQSVLATGGGPSIRSIEIDPDVSAIAPHLMSLAPFKFSCNLMSDNMIEERNKINQIEENHEPDEEIIHLPSTSHSIPGTHLRASSSPSSHKKVQDTTPRPQPLRKRQQTGKAGRVDTDEAMLKLARIEKLMQYDEQLFQMKMRHVNEMHSILIESTKKKLELEVRAATAQTELAELLLLKETLKK